MVLRLAATIERRGILSRISRNKTNTEPVPTATCCRKSKKNGESMASIVPLAGKLGDITIRRVLVAFMVTKVLSG